MSERFGRCHLRCRSGTAVLSARVVVNVSPPAAEQDSHEFGVARAMDKDADGVRISDSHSVGLQTLWPRCCLISPRERANVEAGGCPDGPACRYLGGGQIQVNDSLHTVMLAQPRAKRH